MYLLVRTLNIILLTSDELQCLCTSIAQSILLRICRGGRVCSEQKINIKIDDYRKDVNGVKTFEYLFHCWCYNPVATFSLPFLIVNIHFWNYYVPSRAYVREPPVNHFDSTFSRIPPHNLTISISPILEKARISHERARLPNLPTPMMLRPKLSTHLSSA